MVTREGLPIGYEVFPGATYEGHSLVPVLQGMKRRHQVERTVCVADRGMLSADNLDAMDTIGGEYVVGARLRKLPLALLRQILDPAAYAPLEGSQDRRVGEWEYKGRRLIVVFCPERARKDAHQRRHQVERLLDRLARSDNPKELLSNHGAKRFIAVEGDARLTVNPEKIAEAERWDGLAGVITNLRDASVTEVMSHYQGLWQVEESFRITKHDLRVRPIWHWNPDRIRAPHRHRLHGLRLRPPTLRTASPSRSGGCLRRSSAPPSSTANARCCAVGNRPTVMSSPPSRPRRRNRSTRPWGCPLDGHPLPARLSAD